MRRPVGIIRVRDLATEARLGVLPEERRSPQIIQIDLDIWTDLTAAAASDSLEETVNYVAIANEVRAAASRDCHLIETLAARVHAAVVALRGVSKASVRVRKRHLPGMGTVGYVEVEVGGGGS
jgi:dihydroneopterin aldolase